MGKTITLKTFDALNILFWIESEDSFWNNTKLPIKLQWDMKKNIDAFSEIRNTYNDFYRKVQQKYSDDKYSKEVTTENGQVDRMVKEEFISEYNKELNDILSTDNEVKIQTLYRFCETGEDKNGSVCGELKKTGELRYVEKLKAAGL